MEMPKRRNWENWTDEEEYSDYLIKRATGELEEMECSKQLVKLVEEVYLPDYKILDVCCSAGHYYRGLKRINPDISYTGIDITKRLILAAKEIFKNDKNAHFEVGDIYNLPLNDKSFQIVFCFNTIQNLPDFREPLKELCRATGKYCFIRTLISNRSYFIKETLNGGKVCYHNIYTPEEVEEYVASICNFDMEIIEDEFNIKLEKSDRGTYTTDDGKQVLGNIIY